MAQTYLANPKPVKPKALRTGQLLYSEDDNTLILITHPHTDLLGSGIRVTKSGYIRAQEVNIEGDHLWREAPAGSFIKFTQE